MSYEAINNDAALVAFNDQLEAELQASLDAYQMEPSSENRDRFKAAQLNMRAARAYWRGVGEAFGQRSFISGNTIKED